ncbi:MAG: adenosylcobinamide-GDP ribazoletransferase [Actinomycetota bacterium]|nr:MAG: adenosylcobinamide-GDP ribazoletransferase [Actinomycetota bacterium]
MSRPARSGDGERTAAPRRVDGLLLAVGTLTAIRVPPPRSVDRRTARAAVLAAPLVGAGLAVIAALIVFAARLLLDRADRGTATVLADLVAATLGIAALAVATRGLHLDGLADTADGLGSRRPRDEALQLMRRSDIGPFGVTTLVLVLLLDAAALATCISAGHGTQALIAAGIGSRLAVVWACHRRIPAARTDGLGASVAGTVGTLAAVAVTLASLAAVAVVAWHDDDASLRSDVVTTVAPAVGVLAGLVLVRLARRRLGGVTGDVLGAVVEIAGCVTLLVVAAA